MKSIILVALIACGAAVVSGGTYEYDPLELFKYEEGQRYFYYSDSNGVQFVDTEMEESERKFTPEKDMTFNLFTRKNPTRPDVLIPGNSGSVSTSNFDKSKPVKIVIHGWISDVESHINPLITDAYLKVLDVNVICVDWDKGANVLYGSAVKNVPVAAKWVAALVDFLVKQGAPLKNFHLMGHSLGAHMAGISARSVTAGKFPFVTGFDPAAPSWGKKTARLAITDATYVEVIHTNTGSLGLKDPLGHNDFYPNKGTGQPGCLVNMACSHARSYEFFADSLDHVGFKSFQCTDVKELYKGKCANISILHMGGSKPKNPVGIFHLLTNSRQPYYKN